MFEPIFIKLGTYAIAPEPISKTYFGNACHQSVHLYVHVCRQRLGENCTEAKIKEAVRVTALKAYRVVRC
jgi:hypothetical protein